MAHNPPDQGLVHLRTLIRISGLAAILGTLLYAVSDVLLVGVTADLADHPALQPHAALLGKMVKLAAVPKWRLVWGGLLGIFAAPLTVAGFWQMYRGLLPAGPVVALPPLLLFEAIRQLVDDGVLGRQGRKWMEVQPLPEGATLGSSTGAASADSLPAQAAAQRMRFRSELGVEVAPARRPRTPLPLPRRELARLPPEVRVVPVDGDLAPDGLDDVGA